ncbi:hypothetical protein DBR32_12955 [Taibaiella sp. KBW10]|uniref:ComF family protein n=1 Tax=Taibaiella sp. KBW10 TaxID=2153357 RepID=UPI000F5B0F44|nr:ComF family protein [Taibaiella sp. KBW10]RQO30468.1 hypothetical protein DBR32_12955 [Taibaiella sp. KBW10]
MRSFRKYFLNPLLDLLYPQYCVVCDTLIPGTSQVLCLACAHRLPFTGLEQIADNETDIRLYGKIHHLNAAPLLYFIEEGMVQVMMHQLKYKNRPDIGHYLGTLIAARYAETEWFQSIEAIVPVPLHPKKEYRRGYNQAQCIAEGISAYSHIPLLQKAVVRKINTDSQIHKSRAARLVNVTGAFEVHKAPQLKGKHILLVDDVFTTGATIASCGNCILQVEGTTLSMATAAMAIL